MNIEDRGWYTVYFDDMDKNIDMKILYQFAHRSPVIKHHRKNKLPPTSDVYLANFILNLETGEILKDRYGNEGNHITEQDLEQYRLDHNYYDKPPIKNHFTNDLFEV